MYGREKEKEEEQQGMFPWWLLDPMGGSRDGSKWTGGVPPLEGFTPPPGVGPDVSPEGLPSPFTPTPPQTQIIPDGAGIPGFTPPAGAGPNVSPSGLASPFMPQPPQINSLLEMIGQAAPVMPDHIMQMNKLGRK